MVTDSLKIMNWLAFIFVIVLGVLTAYGAITQLLEPSQGYDSEQSRVAFNWGSDMTITTVVLLISLIALIIFWKRVYPFNVPIVILIFGVMYLLFFITFTSGWVGLQGLMGLAICIIVSIFLTVFHAVVLYKESR